MRIDMFVNSVLEWCFNHPAITAVVMLGGLAAVSIIALLIQNARERYEERQKLPSYIKRYR